jgi:hypothetical protein
MDNSDLDELNDTGDWLLDLSTYAFRPNSPKMATIRTASLRELLRRLGSAENRATAAEQIHADYQATEADRSRELKAGDALGRGLQLRADEFLEAANETFDMNLPDTKKLERLKALQILLRMNIDALAERFNESP